MRVIIIIALLLQVSFINGQANKKLIITIDEALSIAHHNNPSSASPIHRKKLTNDIKSSWYQWLYKIHKWKTLCEYEYLLSDLDRIAAMRYKTGDIDLLEESTLLTRLSEVRTETAISANEIDITENFLQQLLFVQDGIVPADSVLSIYEVDKGYGNTEIIEYNTIPGVIQDSALTGYQQFVTDLSVKNKQLELDGYFIKLQFYNSVGLNHANTILQISKAKFETEEIDYLEFTENIAKAFEIRLTYLETLNNYNQSAIKLEYYAY